MVNTERQKSLLMSHGKWHLDLSVPIFPLNTDGIDPQATNVLIEDSFIQSFDDSVAVKPCHSGMRYCQCAENIMVRNMKTRFGVGMTIGSVPPRTQVNCVRNVTFANIAMDAPIKGVYIKTNPGENGSGIIDRITYENVTMDKASWCVSVESPLNTRCWLVDSLWCMCICVIKVGDLHRASATTSTAWRVSDFGLVGGVP